MSKPFFLICFLFGLFSFSIIRSQDITLNRDHASLQELLLQIHDQTGYFFFYSNDDLAEAKPVWIHVNKAPLEEVLAICFAGQPLVYRIDNKTITVQKKSAVSKIPVDVKGKVLTEQGDPLEDASVEIAATHRAVSTNGDGEFSFEKVPEESVLVFSHVGYQSQTITLSKNLNLTVILKRSASRLDEVQVIAYGSTTRRLGTGDVSSITRETLEQQPVANPLEALEGRVSGVYISSQTGVPGGAINVQIRGQNSLRSAGNKPFYIIDGMPYTATSVSSANTSNSTLGGNPLNEINPADIERIEILKDADATAIYGSRGANGVVLITTKKGRSGKMKLTLNATAGAGQVAHRMPLLNTSEYLQMRHEAFLNDGMEPGPYDFDLNGWDTTRYTDWQKTLIGGTAGITDFQASVSGGSENVQCLFSGTYHRQGTVFPGNLQDQKKSLHLAINTVSENKRFRSSLTTSYLQDKNELSSIDLTAEALTEIPDAPQLYDSTGKLNWNGYFDNPLAYLLKPYTSRINNLISNLEISYELTAGLHLRCSGGYNQIQSKENTANLVASYNPANAISSGSAIFAQTAVSSWILEPRLTYDHGWGRLKFSVLLGSSFQENKNESQSLSASGYSNDLLLGSLAGASQIKLLNTSTILYRYQAVFARLTLQWKEKLLLTLTGRQDGSSRFGPGNQFANFGSLAAGWIFSKERVFKNHFRSLSFGKIRASYGTTGNDQIGDYGFLSVYSASRYTYQGVSGLYPTSLFNPDYSWEINKKTELGLDLGFFQDRLLFSASLYRNRSSNQLVGQPLPLITGFGGVQANLPALVQNQGIEFEVNSLNVKSANFSWKTSFNISFPQNRLIAFSALGKSTYANTYVTGKSLSIVKAFHYRGVDPQTGLFQYDSPSQGGSSLSPDYPDDLQYDKSVSQSFYGGLLNSFRFHQFELDLFIQFVRQAGRNYLYGNFNQPGMQGNQPVYVLDRWQRSGDQRNFQRFSQDYDGDPYAAFSNISSSDLVVSDASFLRLKNLSISYSFPNGWTRAMHMSEGKLFFRAQNLLTVSGYQGLDPETQSTLQLPPLRVWTIGIQCIF